jgi:dihydrofolate reductase
LSRPATRISASTGGTAEPSAPTPAAGVRALKGQEGPDLLTQGSTEFLQTLFRHDLVDEIKILTFPVVLGAGKRLFGDGAAPATLKLVNTTVSPSGVTASQYVRGGPVATGSFQFEPPSEAESRRRSQLS